MAERIETLHMVGGNAALDFANTVSSRSSGRPGDNLHTYADLLTWGQRAGVITKVQKQSLEAMAAADPAAAARALKQAAQLREAIFSLFIAIAGGDSRPEPALIALNGFVDQALRRARIVSRGSTAGTRAFDLDFDPAGRLDGMLAPIVWSAVELLRGGELGRVKICGKDTCGWLFVDRSKNRSRRWCEMSDCGNTVKARRHYERTTRRARAGETRETPQPRKT